MGPAAHFAGALRFEEYLAARRLHHRGVLPLWLPVATWIGLGSVVVAVSAYLGEELWAHHLFIASSRSPV